MQPMQIIIENMERDSATGGVKTVHWRLNKTDGTHTATAYGSIHYTPDSTDPNFTPFEQLTEAQVQGWISDYFGQEAMEAYEASLDKQLVDMQTPPVLNGMPWSQA